jgi:HlyD family type I secretion membrane fusion protein
MKRLLVPAMGKPPSAERTALASMGREVHAVGSAAQQRDTTGRLMAAAVAFEIVTYRRAIRAALIGSAALVLGIILYICTSRVEEITIAEGQITPSSAVQTVQHLEGGIVAAILVVEGQKVEAGDVLIQLDNRQEMAVLSGISARYVSLLLRQERLSAIVQQREPDFAAIGADYPQLVQEQQRTLAAQLDQRRSALSVLSAQIDQRTQEVTQLRRQLETAQEQAKIVAEQADFLQKAVEAGVTSRQTYLATSRTLSSTRGEVARLTNQIGISQQQLAEAQQRRDNVGHAQVQDARNELADIGTELEQVRGLLDKERDRIARLEIKTPAAGLVQDLKIHSIGEVVPAGGQVARIVPITEELEGAIRINPNDIGFLKVGQPVRIKVSTFETRRYGTVEATLSKLSAITFNDERGPPYYKGTVTLARNTIGKDEETGSLTPGMTFEADIITGSRSLVQYLLAPNAIQHGLPPAPETAEPGP